MSKERECPSCAMMCDAEEEVCPYCGYEFPEMPRSVRWVAWVMALLLIWPLIELLRWIF